MSEERFAKTPEPPYYAVIFTFQRNEHEAGFAEKVELMTRLAKEQPGYIGTESAGDASGFGILVSYWADLASIAKWRTETSHAQAQAEGKSNWFEGLELRISKVERAYNFRK